MHDSVAIKIRAVIVMCLNHSQIYDLTHNEDFPKKTKKKPLDICNSIFEQLHKYNTILKNTGVQENGKHTLQAPDD